MTKDEHRSTARVLSILSTLSSEKEGLTLAELSQRLQAPKSSLFPIVHTMADQNFIFYNETAQKYTIGLNSYLVGISYMNRHNVFERIKDEMKTIVQQCSEICQFGILEHDLVLWQRLIPQSLCALPPTLANGSLPTAPVWEKHC